MLLSQSCRIKSGIIPALLLFLVMVFFPIHKVHASTSTPTYIFLPKNINTSTTWTKANSPYVIFGSGLVNVTSLLTIEPGVVVKFQPDKPAGWINGMKVANGGSITAIGTDTDPIVFTSYADDSFGGDTNLNSSSTVPTPGDWDGLIFGHWY